MWNESQREFEAYIDEMDLITILLPKHRSWETLQAFLLIDHNGHSQPLHTILYEEHVHFYKYQCKTKNLLKIEWKAFVQVGTIQTDLQVGAVIRTKEFDEHYAYYGDDLGATYSPYQTLFKVWAPSAKEVKLKLQKQGQKDVTQLQMHQKPKGIWELAVEGECEGSSFTYLVCVNGVWREAVDPYTKAVSINGKQGFVVNQDKLQPHTKVLLPKLGQPTDAIIYETHIRDFTIQPDSGVQHKGKYRGFTESTQSTGIDYLVDLGITHIELLPVNDFGGINEENPLEKYNWGYNPLHFFAPEGSYCSNPKDPYNRIIELQNMIRDIHTKGLKVILDVVFNHVYIKEESSFEKIVPGYYFRYNSNGMPSNGTGVGNDLATERVMVRKLIVECVLYWIHLFQVDGFRFDLMGILDVATMNEIRRKIDEVDDSILMLGEGWELNTPLPTDQKATTRNSEKMPRIAHFNDRFRDLVKGSTFNLYDRGYTLGSTNRMEEVKHVVAGSVSHEHGRKASFIAPSLSINYVESHDNHTFWDKVNQSNGFEDEQTLKSRQRLATCMVLLSQGIPFLHSGQEFYRTKQGIGNSYNSPDEINWLDWSLKNKFDKDVQYIRGLIQLRKSHGAFRFTTTELIRKHVGFLSSHEGVIAYNLSNVEEFGPWNQVLILFNNNNQEAHIDLNEKNSWNVLADHQQASAQSLYRLVTKKLIIQPISCLVVAKGKISSST
ncbi:type I pullulanase [Bacillus sp. DJP31]|uniref:type I pullulanase n=1 Tax=Bacillus sp. DJP31 TaxID=3409789 RepID=UPI003BB5C3E0